MSKPKSYCIRYIDEEEIKDIKKTDTEISAGPATAILNFLIVCAYIKLTDDSKVCNFLIHPSLKIQDHQTIAEKIGEFLNDLLQNINEDDAELKANFKTEWSNLHTTKPEIKSFLEIYNCINDILFNTEVKIATLNSKSDAAKNFDTGFNIVVGGNTLGRGVTFPSLQTVYYSRTAKVPQADTFWQHCRIFGYDRDRALIRLFMPQFIHKLFHELNSSQKALVKKLTEYGLDNSRLMYIDGVKPTRENIVKASNLQLITGGVNYFSAYPLNRSVETLDDILLPYTRHNTFTDVPLQLIEQILNHISSENKDDWSSRSFINAVRMISKPENTQSGKLLVCKDRSISKHTGTMLSAGDRKLTAQYSSFYIPQAGYIYEFLSIGMSSLFKQRTSPVLTSTFSFFNTAKFLTGLFGFMLFLYILRPYFKNLENYDFVK